VESGRPKATSDFSINLTQIKQLELYFDDAAQQRPHPFQPRRWATPLGCATKMKMPATAGILNYLANFQTRELNLQHFPYRENA